MRVSLTDIAKACGVSKMTVSRALRNQPHVEASVGKLIRAKAKELGYKIDVGISEIMSSTRRSPQAEYRGTIGLIRAGGEVYPSDLSGLKDQAALHRYRVDEFDPTRPKVSGRRMAEVLLARGIRGVIILPNALRRHPHYWLPWQKFAVVLIGSSLRNRGLLRVQHNHLHAGIEAMRQAKHRGFRRPGLLLDPVYHERSWRVHAAAMAAYSPTPIDLKESIFWKEGKLEADKLLKWLKRVKPDVLLVQDSASAYNLLQAGLKIPDELSVIVLNLQQPDPRWAGIVQNGRQIGEEAMKALAWKLHNNEIGTAPNPPTIDVNGEWSDGASLG